MNKNTKKFFSRFFQNKCRNKHGRVISDKSNPLEVPLYDKSRMIADKNDSDSWYEYGILHMEDWSDEAVSGYFDSRKLRIYSQYDCTGKPFTFWLHWHRNPDRSVSFVHQLCIDV